MKYTYLLHGFNVKDKGRRTVGKLTPFLVGFSRIINHSYGWFGLFQVLWRNKAVAKKLVTRLRAEVFMKDQAYVVAHSNGCAILLRALKMGAEFETVVLINPALNIRTKFPDGVKKIVVIYTSKDKAVRAARFFDSIPILELMIPDAWGAMGEKGYKGDDSRVVNMDLSDTLDGHSSFADFNNIKYVAKIVAGQLYN